MSARGLVLFAHGARDPRWADPFAAIVERIRTSRPDLRVTLAFLEHLEPDLPGALRGLAAEGVLEVRVVPLFFGRGGHLREDFPAVLEVARSAAPGLRIEVSVAAGEAASVQQALADFAARDF
jgi:sirohydrochlorin cobaltochelatase